MTTRAELIADLLMGAAHGETMSATPPYETVRHALQQVMGAGYVLTEIDDRLRSFDPDDFDLPETVRCLALRDELEKRQLLELIVAVHEGGEVIDLDEDTYLRQVTDALGLPQEAYEDLLLEVVELQRDSRDSIVAARDSLLGPPPMQRRGPPPLPTTA